MEGLETTDERYAPLVAKMNILGQFEPIEPTRSVVLGVLRDVGADEHAERGPRAERRAQRDGLLLRLPLSRLPRLHRGLSRGLRQAAAERLFRVGERGAV